MLRAGAITRAKAFVLDATNRNLIASQGDDGRIASEARKGPIGHVRLSHVY